MTHGFACDVPGDDTVMEEPEASMFIDLSRFGPQEALTVIQQIGVEATDVSDEELGALVRGEDVTNQLSDVSVHMTVGHALTALSAVGVVNIDTVEADDE